MASLTTSLERLGAALGQLSHAKANFLKNKFPELTYENGTTCMVAALRAQTVGAVGIRPAGSLPPMAAGHECSLGTLSMAE